MQVSSGSACRVAVRAATIGGEPASRDERTQKRSRVSSLSSASVSRSVRLSCALACGLMKTSRARPVAARSPRCQRRRRDTRARSRRHFSSLLFLLVFPPLVARSRERVGLEVGRILLFHTSRANIRDVRDLFLPSRKNGLSAAAICMGCVFTWRDPVSRRHVANLANRPGRA